MILGILIGAGIVFVASALFFVWHKKQQPAEELFERHAQKALSGMMQEVIRATREQLGAEKREISETVSKDLRLQSDAFKELTLSLQREIHERQQEIRKLEEDRNRKYGEISQALTDYKQLTGELRTSTEQLKKVLSNNQLRGSWGELQAEKILDAAGMLEGKHYAKQQPIEGFPQLRPDFTLYLPNSMSLFVDVKFPLTGLQHAMASQTEGERAQYLKQFGDDLKARIKEVNKYIIPNANCVDYVILFVPSESVFEIINKHFPAIIDASFGQQVILVSPHSFFAVVRTIQESYTHFYYEQNLREILQHLQQMLQQFERFKGEFSEVGKALASAQTKYDKLATTRYRQIERLSDKINSYDIEKGEQPLMLMEAAGEQSEYIQES